MLIKKLPQIETINFAIYGSAGTGKTYSLSTLPDYARPVYIADFDNGLKSLINTDKCDEIYADYFDSWRKFMLMFHELLSHGTVKQEGKLLKPKTFVIDTWTFKEERQRDDMFQGVPENMELKTWKIFILKDKGFLMQMGHLPMNTITLMHDAVVYEEGTGLRWFDPVTYGATSNMPRKLPNYFDEFYFCDVGIPAPAIKGGRKYNWITAASRVWLARTRTTTLPTLIPQDFAKVFEAYGLGDKK